MSDSRLVHICSGLAQCLSTGRVVHPRVYQNFPGVYQLDGVYRGVPYMCVLFKNSHIFPHMPFAPALC